jgi:hypothetical protein
VKKMETTLKHKKLSDLEIAELNVGGLCAGKHPGCPTYCAGADFPNCSSPFYKGKKQERC